MDQLVNSQSDIENLKKMLCNNFLKPGEKDVTN
jgi:hypothetical protein